jgi:hypothetical protein
VFESSKCLVIEACTTLWRASLNDAKPAILPFAASNADAAEESDCAARDRPDKTEIRSDDFAVTIDAPVATPAVAVAASAVAVAASAVAVAAPAVTAVSTSCATGTLFSALPAHYGERAKHSFCSGDGREARPHNWW